MKNRVAFFVIVLTLLLSAARPALAQSRTYTTIDVPGAIETGASGINNLGQIVGGYVLPDGSRHGFLYSGGTFTTIDDPNSTTMTSEALGINNSGQIVGAFDLNSPEGGHQFEGAHAFLYNAGIFTTLDYPAAGVTHTTASRINNSSNIVGVYRINDGPGNGFLDAGGAFSTVNVPAALGCCIGSKSKPTRLLRSGGFFPLYLRGSVAIVTPRLLQGAAVIGSSHWPKAAVGR